MSEILKHYYKLALKFGVNEHRGSSCDSEDVNELIKLAKEIISALKIQELVKKEAYEQVGTPWGFKLLSLIEESEKTSV